MVDLWIITLRRAGWVAACLLSFWGNVAAQGVRIGRDGPKLMGFGDANVDKTVEHWTRRAKDEITSEIDLQIEWLTEVCQLSESEVEKLHLTTRVIATQRVASGQRQLRKFIVQSELVPGNEPEIRQAVEIGDENRLIFFGARDAGNGVVEFRNRFKLKVTEHPLWIKILRSALSQQQFERYEQQARKRNGNFLSTAIEQSIDELDAVVYLSQAQRDSIREHFLDQFGKRVTPLRPMSHEEALDIVRAPMSMLHLLHPFLRKSQAKRLADQRQRVVRGGVTWVMP